MRHEHAIRELRDWLETEELPRLGDLWDAAATKHGLAGFVHGDSSEADAIDAQYDMLVAVSEALSWALGEPLKHHSPDVPEYEWLIGYLMPNPGSERPSGPPQPSDN